MPLTNDPDVRRALAARMRFYNEMGIYDFYQRPQSQSALLETATTNPERTLLAGEEMSPRKSAAASTTFAEESVVKLVVSTPVRLPEQGISDPVKALHIIREDLGDCTRCPLHMQGRKQIVFGVGNPGTELMFIGPDSN